MSISAALDRCSAKWSIHSPGVPSISDTGTPHRSLGTPGLRGEAHPGQKGRADAGDHQAAERVNVVGLPDDSQVVTAEDLQCAFAQHVAGGQHDHRFRGHLAKRDRVLIEQVMASLSHEHHLTFSEQLGAHVGELGSRVFHYQADVDCAVEHTLLHFLPPSSGRPRR